MGALSGPHLTLLLLRLHDAAMATMTMIALSSSHH